MFIGGGVIVFIIIVLLLLWLVRWRLRYLVVCCSSLHVGWGYV